MRPLFLLLLTLAVAGPSQAGTATPQAAPELQLRNAAGQPGSLADYRGRWVLVHFWASWCAACVKELPSLERLQQALPPLAVLPVNLGDRPAQVQALYERLGLKLPLLRESGARAMQRWQVEGLPLSFLIDPEGHVISRISGSRDWDSAELRDWLRQWLQSSTAPSSVTRDLP